MPLSCNGEKVNSLDWSGLGSAFEGLSVTTLEGKEKGKAGEEGIHEAAHDHGRDTTFAVKPSPSATGPESSGPTTDSAMGTLGGHLKRSARAVQLFGRLAILETHL